MKSWNTVFTFIEIHVNAANLERMLFLVQVGTFALQAKCCDLACYYLVSVVGPTFYFQEFFIAPSKILYARQRKHAMILLNEY